MKRANNKRKYLDLKILVANGGGGRYDGGISDYPKVTIDVNSIVSANLYEIFRRYMKLNIINDDNIDEHIYIHVSTMGKIFKLPITFTTCTGKNTDSNICDALKESPGICILFGNIATCQICLILHRVDEDTLYITHLYGNMKCFSVDDVYEKTPGWMTMCTMIELCKIIGIKKITLTDTAKKGDDELHVSAIFIGDKTYYSNFGFVPDASYDTIESMINNAVMTYYNDEEYNKTRFGENVYMYMNIIYNKIDDEVSTVDDMNIITKNVNQIYYDLMQMHPSNFFLDIVGENPSISDLKTFFPDTDDEKISYILLYLREKKQHATMKELHKKIYDLKIMQTIINNVLITSSVIIHPFYIYMFRIMLSLSQYMILYT